jgi:hypothetical protein
MQNTKDEIIESNKDFDAMTKDEQETKVNEYRKLFLKAVIDKSISLELYKAINDYGLLNYSRGLEMGKLIYGSK